MPAVKQIRLETGQVVRINPVAQLGDLTLHPVYGIGIEACRWQNGTAMLLFNADNDVAASPVMDIIGKRAHGMHDIFRVPALLEFKTLPFNDLPIDQFVDIDGKTHGYMSI
jgi:hypothetical protein